MWRGPSHRTPPEANVLAAVADANVIIYFGHGYGHPSPYGGLNSARQNGWGLQGPRARGTHGDSLNGELEYVGEDWIVANARPAPGFVMIYSNTCYAPGASEGGQAAATPAVAAQRVAHYSRKVFTMGGSAYFATDFDRGAADLVTRLLGNRFASFGTAFASDARFVPSALTSQAHPFAAGQAVWLHRSKYTDGPPNYWYAFAGNPDLSPALAWDRAAPTATLSTPLADHAADSPIRLQFSEPVSGVDAASLLLRDADGAPVPATVDYDASTRTATISPASPLEMSASYRLEAGTGIADEAGRSMTAGSWPIITRIDADPITDDLSVILEAGTHELLRLGADGTTVESRSLAVGDRRWVLADGRARLIGRDGSWLHIDDASIGAWWVAESATARVVGLVEEARLEAGSTIGLSAGRHALLSLGPDGPERHHLTAIAGGVDAEIDRRRIHDGRTFVHLVDPRFGGAWVEAGAGSHDIERAANRVLASEPRATPARLIPGDPVITAFRFDDRGRVVERRSVAVADLAAAALRSVETLRVGTRSFALIEGGELSGWGLPEGPPLQAVPLTDGPTPPG